MSHFYATIQGNRGQASRQGTKRSGIESYTAGWEGGVRACLWEQDGVDHARVELRQWRGHGAWLSILLYDGPVSGEGCQSIEALKRDLATLANALEVAEKCLDEEVYAETKQLLRKTLQETQGLDVTEAAP